MKNEEVQDFAKFLMSFELKGRESRLRTRFVKILGERATLIEEDHNELIRQFATFNEKGEPNIVEINGRKAYDVPDRAAFNKEYFLLLHEDFVIDENEERKELLLFIKDIILNCEKTFKGGEALEYDRWCDIVEEIKYE
ncbi:hypothetical protein [Paenibacillus odorifer]|uniref:hypothetical protein n=1 Tax=Paenibacillus odorifer TaxID=189426 RepID=UPI0021163F7B|nr:hypothetical protein [Paenibacillus odorifer]